MKNRLFAAKLAQTLSFKQVGWSQVDDGIRERLCKQRRVTGGQPSNIRIYATDSDSPQKANQKAPQCPATVDKRLFEIADSDLGSFQNLHHLRWQSLRLVHSNTPFIYPLGSHWKWKNYANQSHLKLIDSLPRRMRTVWTRTVWMRTMRLWQCGSATVGGERLSTPFSSGELKNWKHLRTNLCGIKTVEPTVWDAFRLAG